MVGAGVEIIANILTTDKITAGGLFAAAGLGFAEGVVVGFAGLGSIGLRTLSLGAKIKNPAFAVLSELGFKVGINSFTVKEAIAATTIVPPNPKANQCQ